jgi:prepilin-type N-terminal cleavage/methylation domain-containing protein
MKLQNSNFKHQGNSKSQAPTRCLEFEAWSFTGTWNLALGAFTLLELLAVITIIGILAAIALPALKSMKPNIQAAGARQLLDDVNRARQLAISQRTTVFMVFCPSNYWNDPAFNNLAPVEKSKTDRLTDRQLIGYTYVSLSGVGDQPGKHVPRYWTSWRRLPPGAFIPMEKFQPRNQYVDISTSGVPAFRIFGFSVTNNIPFPSEDAYTNNAGQSVYVSVPYIAFNYLGQLTSGQNELIPITQGSVGFQKDPTTHDIMPRTLPNVSESPAGSSTNIYHLVNIDWVTGRARIEHQVVQ